MVFLLRHAADGPEWFLQTGIAAKPQAFVDPAIKA
jgi:hypothetical protein